MVEVMRNRRRGKPLGPPPKNHEQGSRRDSHWPITFQFSSLWFSVQVKRLIIHRRHQFHNLVPSGIQGLTLFPS
jgi:hypothetical protein